MGTERLAWAGRVMMSGGDHGHLAARHASDLRNEATVDGGPSAFDQLQGAGHVCGCIRCQEQDRANDLVGRVAQRFSAVLSA
jgi:hypothetical protein